MLTFGLIINPVAGMGGATGLKGSDGARVQARARASGGRGRGSDRAARALAAAGPALHQVRWLTWGGAMGATALQDAGIGAEVLGQPGAVSVAADTRAAATAIRDAGADLVVFCGGDGTARDLLEPLGGRLPVLGVPSGVKMHSGVFAATPEAAGRVLAALVEGGLVAATPAEVRDLDEAAVREGRVVARYHGELDVPALGGFLQHTKEGGRESEPLAVQEIVAEIVERIEESPGDYVLGPGGTLAAIKSALGLEPTLLGFDVLRGSRVAGTDVNAGWLEELVSAGEPPTVIVSFTRRQGFLLGRGNQQLSPRVLRAVGRKRLWVVGTRSKLVGLDGRPFLIDTDDPELDRDWSGLIEVITGYQDRLLYRVEGTASSSSTAARI